ncbi:TetR/AcrR family transcriptional regulator [Nocardia blacklockiae]|uniref:TetR/AcrR family transcriptional regulator n=1 Tax=Nocardia blacklockiae TaxID=480036 RepID=UPI001894C06D|nr:TetR/AcrR family transcriptional regulator [Nocardia blacklockiae]MBF6171874.1 helix-turn-helix transcriptional regulator [Nocardia blacklockiae]
MGESETPTRRRPRADARRNRAALLAAAEEVFGAGGADAPLEHVARRAGVGIGTLYGHFPTRRALIAALLAERNEALFAHGDRLLAAPPTLDAVADWVRSVVEHAATYRGLAVVLVQSLDDGGSELHESCRRMNAIGEELVARAGEAAAIGSDVTAADVFTLVNAAAWTREHAGAEQAERLITLTLNGLRA